MSLIVFSVHSKLGIAISVCVCACINFVYKLIVNASINVCVCVCVNAVADPVHERVRGGRGYILNIKPLVDRPLFGKLSSTFNNNKNAFQYFAYRPLGGGML